MAVGTQGLPIHKCLGHSVDGLVTVKTQHFRHYCCGSNFDQNDVIKANSVERVEECEAALDLMGLDHSLEDVADFEWLPLTRKVIGDSQNGSKIVRRMAPYGINDELMIQYKELDRHTFCGQKAVIEIEPSNDGANVECTTDRIQLVVSSRDLGTYGRIFSTGRKLRAANTPFGTMVPSTTGPRSFVHSGNLRPSRPHPMVSIRQSLAVSNASSESML